MLLDIEARIGELIETIPRVPRQEPSGRLKGSEKQLPDGITKRRSYQARTIKDNPYIVAKVKARARENEEMAVLNAINYERR